MTRPDKPVVVVVFLNSYPPTHHTRSPLLSSPMASSLLSLPSPPTFSFLSTPFKPNTRPLLLRATPTKPPPSRSLSIRASAAELVRAEATGVVRFRLDNLGPQKGSRKKGKRKGRGIAAGQGNSCGFGMRGQKSRSGPGVRKGFEGGQMPLYRRIPKLRGIAGGMHAGRPKYVPVNIKDIEAAGFQDGDEISLVSLKQRGLINPSGRESRLPLKILGDGEVTVRLNIKARAFSSSAKEKLEAAGCTLITLPGRKKWVKPSVAKNLARADEYFAKKKATSVEASSEPVSA